MRQRCVGQELHAAVALRRRGSPCAVHSIAESSAGLRAQVAAVASGRGGSRVLEGWLVGPLEARTGTNCGKLDAILSSAALHTALALLQHTAYIRRGRSTGHSHTRPYTTRHDTRLELTTAAPLAIPRAYGHTTPSARRCSQHLHLRPSSQSNAVDHTLSRRTARPSPSCPRVRARSNRRERRIRSDPTIFACIANDKPITRTGSAARIRPIASFAPL